MLGGGLCWGFVVAAGFALDEGPFWFLVLRAVVILVGGHGGSGWEGT